MDITKQTLLLEYLISSVDTFALCTSIIEHSYFDPELRNTVSFIQEYYEDYNTIPDPIQIKAETGIHLTLHPISKDKISYCSAEIEQFCKRRAIEKAISSAPALIQEGDYGKVESIIKDAITVSLNEDLGLNFFEDPESVLNSLKDEGSSTSTGWTDLDAALGGGIKRKEMIMFTANSGGGKSITMANLALNLMKQGENVLYVSLELGQELIAKRYFSMVTGIHQVELVHNISEVAHKVNQAHDSHGELIIKRMPTGTSSAEIRSLLKEFELKKGYLPDALVVDYLDLMSPNEKVKMGDTFEKDKQSAEQLRDIGEDLNMYIVTASQQNRGAIEADEVNQSHIAGGISKANTTDIWVSIIWTAQMKAEGVMKFYLLKTRSSDGVGDYIDLTWLPVDLRMVNCDGASSGPKPLNLKFTRKTNDVAEASEDGSSLMNFINT